MAMQQFSFGEMWSHMGPLARVVVYVLGLMSACSITIMAERLASFVRSSRASRRFADALAAALEEGGIRGASAVDVPAAEAGHLGRVLAAGLAAFRRATTAGTSADVTVESVARALERQTGRELENLRRGVPLLATIGSTAPFVGLLGTVIGIINAFRMMAAAGSGGLGTVSAGIAEALVTTAFGLLVAIPAVVAYNEMQRWTDSRGVDMSEAANELLALVACSLGTGGAAVDAEASTLRRTGRV
jgi:biopolymer transport protein ExbB/biopolymer transport protein TolQ